MPEQEPRLQFNGKFDYYESRVGKKVQINRGGGPSEYDLVVSMTHGNLVYFTLTERHQIKMRVCGMQLVDDPLGHKGNRKFKIKCWSEVYEKDGKLRYMAFEGDYDFTQRLGYFKITSLLEQNKPGSPVWNILAPKPSFL